VVNARQTFGRNHRGHALADGIPFAQFGASAALKDDVIAVGATTAAGLSGQSGAVSLFAKKGGGCSQTATLFANDGGDVDNFGFSVALGRGAVLVGSTSHTPVNTGVFAAGAAYVLQQTDTGWAQTADLGASDGIHPETTASVCSL
jgi:FG-GAP repeat